MRGGGGAKRGVLELTFCDESGRTSVHFDNVVELRQITNISYPFSYRIPRNIPF